eukprot:Nitzschia sp. Nitz4//scaffold42_size132992//92664//93769//NITZ4_003410-RA/size132992-augustus-gene-0.107-mRNA-1//1//CDS//3329551751//8805//frame0
MDLSLQMWADIPNVISHHYKEGNFNWPMLTYISLVHVAAVYGLFCLPNASYETWFWAFLLWPISGFGITVGVHRLWSHRAYEAAWVYRFALMICNSIANQGTIYHWSRDHRVHHKFTECEADPHNAKRGFFFAHMGWLLVKKDPAVIKAGRDMDFSDLLEDSTVRLQMALDPWWNLFWCYVMPALVAKYGWGETFWNGFFVAGALRYCYVLHCTWLVNSAAHLYGDHPYDVTSYPAENPIVSFLAVGEGWHNWHHKYPFDYAASEYGVSAQFNPSKLFIDMCACVGLVWGRKRGTAAWKMGRARRDRDAAAGIPLPKQDPRPWEVKKEVAAKQD